MNIDKKLAQWRAAGLLDEQAAARIAEFERHAHRPILLYALGGLGALTIGIGFISIVAANWDAIPRSTKLGLDLAVGGVIGMSLYRAATTGQRWLTDVLAGVYYLFVLASIALLGQLYQLGSPQYQGLLTWSLATAPFMLLVRGTLLGAVWLAGLVLTEAYCLMALFERLDDFLGNSFAANLAVSVVFASLAGFMILARLPVFARERPDVSDVWTRMLWTALLAGALLVSLAFYSDMNDGLSWAIVVCGVISWALYTRLPVLYADLPARARAGMGYLLGASWLVLATATAVGHGSMAPIGALSQVGLLAIAAWTVLALGNVRTFNKLTGLITLRLLIVYFEIFGSMLDTGIGMIMGGMLTLLAAWFWKRKSPELAERLGAEGTAGHAS